MEIEHADAQDFGYPIGSPEWHLQRAFELLDIKLHARTPARAINAYREMLQGYSLSLQDICRIIFDANPDGEEPRDLIIKAEVDFISICEHHLLPFEGHCTISYKPRDQLVLGASKFARIVEMYARRLQIQERLTQQIADAIMLLIAPEWVEVESIASHACMRCRGVKQRDSSLSVKVLRAAQEIEQNG